MDVEVVGGLVEQQHVGGFDQEPAQVQPPPLAARELAHGLVLLGGREQEALQQLRSTELAAIHLHGAGRFLHHIDHLLLEGLGVAQHRFGVLIEIGQLHGAAQLQASAMGLAPAGDQIQQGGFARAIGANDADAIFRAEVVGEGLQQGGAAGGAGLIGGPHRQVFGFDRPLAQPPLVAGQADLALGLPFGGLLHGLNALDAGLLFGAAGLGPALEPLQLPPQGPLELRLAGGRSGLFLRLAGQVVGVIAAVAAGFAAIHLHDPAGHLIEHVAVVGDQHQGAAEALQIALQPLDAVGVEVVGGLIQQQHVGLGHQGGGQGQALAVAAGEFPHLALGVADAQPIEHLADLLLQVPGLALVHAGIEAAQFR